MNNIRPRLMLLDREFYAVDIMTTLNNMGKKFLMPAVKRGGIKAAILEYHKGARKAVSKYTMTNKNGESFTFILIIKKAKKNKRDIKSKKPQKKITTVEKYVVFATNVSLERAYREVRLIPKEYRLRWGIETAYRQIEEVRPWTTSRDADYHRILFYTTLCMYNMWAIARTKRGIKQKELTLKFLAEIVRKVSLRELQKNSQYFYDPGG